MNSLIETLNHWGGRIPGFAWPMVWQSSVLIAALFVFDLAARRKVRASVRYALWLVALVKLLLPPTLALPTSLAWWVRPPAPPPNAQARTTAFVVTYADFVPANLATPAPRVLVPPPKPSLSGAGRAAATWAVVGAGLLAWLVARWRRVAGDVRKARVAPELLNEVLDKAKDIKLPRRVRLLVTERAMSPAVCGLFRPVILLPQALLERLAPSQLRAVLLHELAHLRRGDVWVNCAQALLQIFYWWHPLLWLANARIRRVREEAVDDAVMLALRDDAEAYAPTLLEVAKLAFNRPLASLGLVGIMESRSALRQRIERLVDFRPPRKAGLTFGSAFCVLAFAALAVPMEQAPPTSEKPTSMKEKSDSSGAAFTGQVSSNSADSKTNVTELVQHGRLLLEAGKLEEAESELKLAIGAIEHELSEIASTTKSEPNATDANSAESEMLVTRTLKFDPEVFLPNLRQRMHLPDKSTDGEVIVALPRYLADAGLDLQPPCSCFLKERGLTLFRAPQQKIEAIERLFTELNNGRAQSEIPVPWRPPDQETIIRKLDQIRIDSPAYNETSLTEVVRDLSWETKHRDPERKGFSFRTRYSGRHGTVDLSAVKVTVQAISNARLSDFMEAVIKGADKPIKYYIWAGVVFYSTEDEPGLPLGMSLEQALALKNATEPADTNNPSLSRMTDRVPVLGDMPLVGKLFRSETNAFHAEAFGTSNSPTESAGRSGLAAAPAAPLPTSSSSEPLQVRNFSVNPNSFYKSLESVSSFHRTNINAALRDFFVSLGVDLSPPKNIFWNERNGGLLVRATAQDLDVIEKAIEVLSRPSPQINIKARFVEIKQEDTRALGFDWYFGNLLMPNGGGTNSVGKASPQLQGVLTDPQFRVVLRALEQRNGADILAAPEVTTVSGRQAQVQVVDLQTVVTGINPQAQVHPGITSTNGLTNSLYQTQAMPFGPVLDVIPYLAADGYTINMTVIPTVTEFLGYDDPAIYGLTNSTAQLDQTVLPLPHFRVRQMTVTANVRDGQTLMLIGTVTTEVLKKPDGSTETKDVSDTQKKQLVVFITSTLIDEAGNRLHSDDESAPGPK